MIKKLQEQLCQKKDRRKRREEEGKRSMRRKKKFEEVRIEKKREIEKEQRQKEA